MFLTDNSDTKNEANNSQPEPTRDEERGDVAETDAPTAEEENEGMSTILDADPVTGVQTDAEEQ